MNQPYIVVFGGAPGSSKSIVAHYLSMQFDLPILCRDIMRSEVKEEFLVSNINEPHALQEYEKRFAERWHEALANGKSFILDGSVDRSWEKVKRDIEAAGFRWFMVNMELSRAFFERLFTATKRPKAIEQLPGYLEQHQAFREKYGDEVTIEISDETFPQRIHVAADGLREFLARA